MMISGTSNGTIDHPNTDKMMNLTTADPSLLQRTRMGFQKAKKLPEEVEQIDESDYKSHFKVRGQYKDKDDNYVGVTHKIKYVKDAGHAKRIASEKVGKQYKDYKVIRATPFSVSEEVQLEAIGAKDKQDEGEYGYEGDMAMSQLRTIIRNSEEMMKVLKKDTDLPEWVQSKITLATDYLQTANDYLMSELEEETEINELSKGLMYRYFSKADKGGSEKRYAGMKLAAQKTIPLKSSVKIQGTGELDPAKEDKRMRKEEVAKDAPFEGGREVKSKESAAVRVKKIAKGMEKLNTPKKDNK